MNRAAIHPALQSICDSAERQGCTVVSAVIGPGDHMPYRATITVEKDGQRVVNAGQGWINGGKFEWGMRYTGPA